jgi:RNA polymerase sigma factor (sigma-70 family)
MGHGEPVQLEPAEVEVLRLTDLEDLSQEEAGERMGVSRGTVWRLQKRARRKIALALTEGRRIEMVATDPE